MFPGDSIASRQQVGALKHLGLQVMGLKAISSLSDRGVDVILLKGPVTSSWLYPANAGRRFKDIDILVRPSARSLVDETLTELGFYDLHSLRLPLHRPEYERTWVLEGLPLDVHTRLAGTPLHSAEESFELLWRRRGRFALLGVGVPCLDEVARGMHAALHAAQSRADLPAIRDLDLATALLPEAYWRKAARLAEDIGCDGAFWLGMSRATRPPVVAGKDLVLPLDVLLRARGAPIEAQQLVEAAVGHPPMTALGRCLSLIGSTLSPRYPWRTRASALLHCARSVPLVASALRQAGRQAKPDRHPISPPQRPAGR